MINKNKNKKENLSEDKEDIKNTEETSLYRIDTAFLFGRQLLSRYLDFAHVTQR